MDQHDADEVHGSGDEGGEKDNLPQLSHSRGQLHPAISPDEVWDVLGGLSQELSKQVSLGECIATIKASMSATYVIRTITQHNDAGDLIKVQKVTHPDYKERRLAAAQLLALIGHPTPTAQKVEHSGRQVLVVEVEPVIHPQAPEGGLQVLVDDD